MIETIYQSRDNPNTVTFKEDGTVIDFSPSYRMVLSFEGTAVVADTDVDSTLIDWSAGAGVVEFNLSDLALTPSTLYPATLISYDATHTDGQVIVHASSKRLMFNFLA